jgi:gas vesicle protein
MSETSKGLLMENKKVPQIAAAFLFGAIIGGVIALLYAPKSGKETREDISDQIDNYIKKASDTKNKFIEKAKKLSNDMVEHTDKVYSDIRRFKEGKYSGTADKIEGEITKLRKAIKAAVDSYKDTKKVRRIFPDQDKYYFTDFNDYLFQDEEEDSLPKFESNKKQSN